MFIKGGNELNNLLLYLCIIKIKQKRQGAYMKHGEKNVQLKEQFISQLKIQLNKLSY